jgi:hypothetical membrane protein
MMQNTSVLSLAAEDRGAGPARLAAAAALAVALLIAALHAIKPEFEPSWRFISEYAIGPYAWIMQLTFLLWSASCAALAVALVRHVRTLPGKTGVGALLLVAIALALAGIFSQDPVTAAPAEHTTHGTLHALASMIGIPGLPIAAILISSSLWRTNPAWSPHRSALMWPAHATWISLLCMVAYLAWAVPRAGGFTSEVWAGWMNRLVVATYLIWQFAVARVAVTLARISPPRRLS